MKKSCKKIVGLSLSLALVCSSAFCGKLTKTDDYYFINGYDFMNYKGTDLSLNELVNEEISDVEKDLQNNPQESFVVVGHSQGGPSSLAFATKWNEKYKSSKQIKAVITVSGIDKGLKALEGGFAPFKAKVTGKVNVLSKGVTGLRAACPIATKKLANEALANMELPYLTDIDSISSSNILKMIGSYCPEYIIQAWNGAAYNELPQIYDMMPDSDFINSYVCKTEKKPYRVQTGTKTQVYWTKSGIFYVLASRQVPVYSYVTVVQDTAKFPSDVTTGYIVGLNNNSLSMLESADFEYNGNKVTEADVRSYLLQAEKYFSMGEYFNITKAALGGTTVVLAVLHGNYAADCKAAKLMCGDFDSTINDLLGSSEHDGLVAKESQYIPKSYYRPDTKKYYEVHSKICCDDGPGYASYPEYNHADINPLTNTKINDRIIVETDVLK